ncbi:Transposase [Chryseobacterium rhizoplanae]|uniref:Transposase n=1 Tax=Chryseobacterium rhizoplanae TaxID=1609531 RepID=A0A521FMK1_9FLAO|nr:IS110 family transposase [Chryseobacterium rhizoplanae]SMO96691.1 Transposase [Chryseobacterium rhizoplanae]
MANLEKKVIGVDVSLKMLTLNYKDSEGVIITRNIPNLKKDILGNLNIFDKEEYKIIVEATGAYSSKILYFSYELGFEVSMVNPVSIKRYGELKNHISKTDAEDSRLIREYGEQVEFRPYTPKSKTLEYLDQELNLWHDLEQAKKKYGLKLKALQQKALCSKETIKHYERLIRNHDSEIEKVMSRMSRLQDEELKRDVDLLSSISGIGEKTALLLLVATNGFKNFANAKQLSKYFGVAPRLYESGTKKKSLGKCRTTKKHVRSILYVCSWTAMRFNSQCRELYERILSKNKSKKVALIAVCNKLLRQCFGIMRNKIPYQKNYLQVGN